MAAQDAYNPGQEAANVTASPNIQAVQARYDPNGSANALVTALGSDSTKRSLENFQQVYDQRKLQEQSLKIDGYTQQFMDDNDGGAVSQAQLKQRFPELVPVIAARVAESIGRKQGALDIASTIEHINTNDSLRLDTAARAAYVAKTRAELFAKIQPGNDFYAAGVVSAMDRAFGQEEQKWQGQTAAYHQEVQKTALSDEVVTALNSADPKAMMTFLDGTYSRSSSLNNVERNKVYVDTTIKTAATSDDPSILDKIPQQYLNADSKAQLYQAKLAITGQQWAKFTRAKEFEAYQRDEKERLGKQEILNRMGSGQDVNPAEFISSPGLHDYALKSLETPKVSEAVSQSTVSAFRTSLLDSSNVMSLGSQNDIAAAIFKIPNINPKDRAALIAEIPKIMEGTVLMNDPNVKDVFTYRVGFRLDDIMKQSEPALQSMLNGTNIRGIATDTFTKSLRGRFNAHLADTGEWPKGTPARELADLAANDALAYIKDHSGLDALTKMTADSNKPTTPKASTGKPAAASKAPTASPALPKGVQLIK